MSSDDRKSRDASAGDGIGRTPVTRRDFLKVAGVAGAALGVAGGGSVLAACGSSSSSSSSSGASGRTIKAGFVSPLTGSLAAFGEADAFCVDQWNAAVKDGLKCGDGQVHPIQIIMKDSQSDSNRAATVAGDLITNDGVDVMMVASSADTVNPVADQAEALGIPCVSNDCPWQAYYFGRGATPDKPFTWTYHFFWGAEDDTANIVAMWDALTTNKKVGEMWPNDADGLARADPKTGAPPLLQKAGYTIVDGGRYQDGSEDFTPQISKFRSAGCDIVNGVMIPPDFTNFWKQSYQQGFRPMVATIGKALLFPSSVEALGDIGYGLTTPVWWSPNHPFKSSLSGQSCQQLADAFTAATKRQWTQPLLHYALFEVVADALKRTKNVDDKQSILDAIKATNLETITGNVNWQAGAPQDPVPNVSKTPLVGGQWVKGTDWPFDLKVVSNPTATSIPVQQDITAIKY